MAKKEFIVIKRRVKIIDELASTAPGVNPFPTTIPIVPSSKHRMLPQNELLIYGKTGAVSEKKNFP
ncbi:3729_t:CDS:2 [Dentiscutata heterogama]|uniref:3729_t:CDS:1 n=1 Tax=Dentiscutata heterogama TaxID=1316150 RepID=A0ACA9KHX2_9GLOM|nr:3729_t:CDS:2 [Dentiscutata heterogama]